MSNSDNYFSELNSYSFEDLFEGQTDIYTHTITESDIRMFAAVSGDTNPIHLNDEFAKKSRFGGRIAHGLISLGFISGIFGTKLPGPGAIYLSQSVQFKNPVMIGDTVVARVTIKGKHNRKRTICFDTTCTVGNKKVLTGEAVIYMPKDIN
ncbi:(R)-hydratase [Candidatus Marinamargulisbacteria bacterium SCGC AG-333-B06]|nr:(R)-hydratase [Candidatus Marinamargulisbacteria bacterium SCGC AG-333-B06]